MISVSKNNSNSWTLIACDGRMDSFNYNSLAKKINTLLRMGVKKVALDFSEVTFASFPHLNYLSKIGLKLKSENGCLAIIGSQERVNRHIAIFNHKEQIHLVSNFEELKHKIL